MNKSNYAFIAALYNNKGAGLYNDVYFPIIKYTIVSLFYKKEKAGENFYDVKDVEEFIKDKFGIHIPLVVLKKSVRYISNKNHDFELDIYENGECFRIKKAWDFSVNANFEKISAEFESDIDLLEKEYKKYLTNAHVESDLRFIDFISDNTDDVLGFLCNKIDLKVNEQYEPVARFLEHIKEHKEQLFATVSKLFWGSIIAAYLSREEATVEEDRSAISEYFLDTSLVMGLLKLSTPEIETYSEDLLKTLLIAKATIRVHPMTCTEIKSIIKSVEEHGAYIGKDISFAVEKYKYTSTDLASIRIHLEEKLSELKISIFPNKEYNLEKKATYKYKKDNRVKQLAHSRNSNISEENYRDIHDVYMYDYILNRSNSKECCQFITLNKDLIEILDASNDTQGHIMIHPYKLTLNLWMNGNLSTGVESVVLTEVITRCFYLNNVDIRNKISMMINYYRDKDGNIDQRTYDAILIALIRRDRKLINFIENTDNFDTNKSIKYDEQLKQDILLNNREVSKYTQDEIESLRTQVSEESRLHEEKKVRISQLRNEVDIVNQKLNDSQKNEKEKTEILEQLKNLSRAKKEKEDFLKKIKADIDPLAVEREHSINLTGFYALRILVIVILLLTIIVFIKSSTWYQISGSVIGALFSTITLVTKLQILTPKVSISKYKKEQYDSWDSRHPRYVDMIKQKGKIEKELGELDSKIEEITQ